MLSQKDEIHLREIALCHAIEAGTPPSGLIDSAQELFLFLRDGLPTGLSDTAVSTV